MILTQVCEKIKIEANEGQTAGEDWKNRGDLFTHRDLLDARWGQNRLQRSRRACDRQVWVAGRGGKIRAQIHN